MIIEIINLSIGGLFMLKAIFRITVAACILLLISSIYMGCTSTKDDNGVAPTQTPTTPDPIKNVGGDADSVKNGTPDNPSGTSLIITHQDSSDAAVLCQAARGSLENEFTTLYCSEINNIDDLKQYMDFLASNDAYKNAIAENPNNTEAQFGAAVTELLVLGQSRILDQVDSLMNLAIFQDETTSQVILGKRPSLFKMARLTPDVQTLENSGVSLAKMLVNTEGTPRISELQDSLLYIVLPAINYALDRFQIIENDPDFVFLLTPELRDCQPSGSGDTIEIDLGEIYLADAALRILRAQILTICAYNYDIDMDGSYGWIEDIDSVDNTDDSLATVMLLRRIRTLFEDEPDFLSLRTTGKDQLSAALTSLQTAIDKGKSSLAFIRSETDDQSDDALKITALQKTDLEISSGDDKPNFARGITTIEGVLDKVEEIISGPFVFTEDFDNDSTTPDAQLTVNISALFNNPIQDFRTLLPAHRWRPESEWITMEVDSGEYCWWEGRTMVCDSFWDTTYSVFPVYLLDAGGNEIDLGGADPFHQIQLSDWTLGGLFPGMTRLEDYEAVFGPVPINDSSGTVAKVLSAKVLF
jgi:hypothetical protein